MSEHELTLLCKRARRAGQPAHYERVGVSLDVQRGKVWLYFPDGDVVSIEVPRLGSVLGCYQDKLQASGLASVTEDGYPRWVFGPHVAPDVGPPDPDDASSSPRWWDGDIEDATHMDLRRWLERCARDRLLDLRLGDFPVYVRETEGDRLLSASDGKRAVERVVRPAEQDWLLARWPTKLREQPDSVGRTRGRLA